MKLRVALLGTFTELSGFWNEIHRRTANTAIRKYRRRENGNFMSDVNRFKEHPAPSPDAVKKSNIASCYWTQERFNRYLFKDLPYDFWEDEEASLLVLPLHHTHISHQSLQKWAESFQHPWFYTVYFLMAMAELRRHGFVWSPWQMVWTGYRSIIDLLYFEGCHFPTKFSKNCLTKHTDLSWPRFSVLDRLCSSTCTCSTANSTVMVQQSIPHGHTRLRVTFQLLYIITLWEIRKLNLDGSLFICDCVEIL